jgi:uncharacterized coiled-coil protein SlyX
MGDDCKNCVYSKELARRVDALESNDKEYEKRITELENRTAVSNEQIKTIFKMLAEIKDSIKEMNANIDKAITKLDARLEVIENRPNNLVWAVITTVVGAIIIAGIKVFGGM